MTRKIAYTAEEVARLLSLSEKTVRRHTSAGVFPCHRIGRAVRYTDEDVYEFLKKWRDAGFSY